MDRNHPSVDENTPLKWTLARPLGPYLVSTWLSSNPLENIAKRLSTQTHLEIHLRKSLECPLESPFRWVLERSITLECQLECEWTLQWDFNIKKNPTQLGF